MAEFINPSKTFPFADAVVYSGRVMEVVICPIPDGQKTPVPGDAADHMREICKQIDEVADWFGLDKTCVISVRLYVQNVNQNIAKINAVYKEYFGSHTPVRCAVGVDLQVGMLVEAVVRCEIPAGATLKKS